MMAQTNRRVDHQLSVSERQAIALESIAISLEMMASDMTSTLILLKELTFVSDVPARAGFCRRFLRVFTEND
jgi:hypothetical protein